MKIIKPSFIYFLLVVCLFVACKKDNTPKNENGQVVVQGNMTIKVHARHHALAVPDLPVYLKRNATSWPGSDSSMYEFRTVTDHSGDCEFNRLFPGNYYVYAHGIDVAVGVYVIGYHGVVLNSSTAPDNTFEMTLLVSE